MTALFNELHKPFAFFRIGGRTTAAVLALSSLSGVLLPTPARAQGAARTVTWTGRGGSAWESDTSWDTGASPDNATTAVNFLTGVTNLISIINFDHSVYGIVFGYDRSNTASSFTITRNGSDNTLNVYGGGIANNTALTQTIDASVTLRASQSFTSVSGGALRFTSGPYNQINLLGNTLTVGGAGTTLISSKIIGNAGNTLIKTGAGTLTLSNIGNSFTGNLSIAQGTLIAGASQTSYNPGTSVLGTTMDSRRTITVGDGTNAATLNFAASQVFGTGNSNPQPGITVNNKGALTNSNNSFNILPTLTLSGGTLQATSGLSATQQAFAFAYGSVYVNGGSPSAIFSSGINSGYHLGGSTTFDVAKTVSAGNYELFVFGNLVDNFDSNGAGSLVKAGAGTMVLEGRNTYTGSTTVNGGTLCVGLNTSSTLGSGTGNVTVNDGGTLNFASVSTAGSATINNNSGATLSFQAASSATTATINNGGTLTFTGLGPRDYSDAGRAIINNNGGTITFEDFASASLATITNNNGALLTFQSDLLISNKRTTAGSAKIINNGGLTFRGYASAGTAAIVNNSATDFYNTSTAASATITNTVFLSFYDASTADTATIKNSGVLFLNQHTGGLTVGDLSGSGNVLLGSNALTIGGLNNSGTISGVLSGTQNGGSLIKTGTGTLNLTGANTYTGGTTVNAGTLVALGSVLSSGAVTLNSGGTLAVGQAVNVSSSPLSGGPQSLSLSSLVVNATAGNTTPFLTFNLFAGGTSDTLSLTGTGTVLSFSSASGSGSQFIVGFASGSGSLLYGTTYNLMTFTNPSAGNTSGFDTNNANNSFVAQGVGNLGGTTGTFQWAKGSNGNITGLQYVLSASVETPEPGSLPLLGLSLVTGMGIIVRKRWRDENGSTDKASSGEGV